MSWRAGRINGWGNKMLVWLDKETRAEIDRWRRMRLPDRLSRREALSEIVAAAWGKVGDDDQLIKDMKLAERCGLRRIGEEK
jgi:hypothetical protein